jgi:hypothetical protein
MVDAGDSFPGGRRVRSIRWTLAPLCQLFNKLDDLDGVQARLTRDNYGRMQRASLPIQIEARAAPVPERGWRILYHEPLPYQFLCCADYDTIGNIIAILRDSQRSSLATC